MLSNESEFLAHLDDLIASARATPFRGHMVALRGLRQVRRAVVNRQRLNSPERRRLHALAAALPGNEQ